MLASMMMRRCSGVTGYFDSSSSAEGLQLMVLLIKPPSLVIALVGVGVDFAKKGAWRWVTLERKKVV